MIHEGTRPGNGRRTRVAMIDDDRGLSRSLQKFMSSDDNFDFLFCLEDGEHAVERLSEQWPEILILDHLMPRCDGFAVLEALRGLRRRLPYIIFTPSSHSGEVMARLDHHLDLCWLFKPYELNQIYQICVELHHHRNYYAGVDGSFLEYLSHRHLPSTLHESFGREGNLARSYQREERRRSYLRDLFTEAGIAYKSSGFKYMVEAALILSQQLDERIRIYETYDDVGEIYGISAEAVEKAIRIAILAAWRKRCADPLRYDGSLLLMKYRELPRNKELLIHSATILARVSTSYHW